MASEGFLNVGQRHCSKPLQKDCYRPGGELGSRGGGNSFLFLGKTPVMELNTSRTGKNPDGAMFGQNVLWFAQRQ